MIRDRGQANKNKTRKSDSDHDDTTTWKTIYYDSDSEFPVVVSL